MQNVIAIVNAQKAAAKWKRASAMDLESEMGEKVGRAWPNPKETTYPWSDTMYDFRHFVQPGPDPRPVATGLPRDAKVAIIGAGCAGCCAAYELLRAGVVPDIFEATGRTGGRLRSEKHKSGADSCVFELGAMRMPKSEAVFWDYCAKFGIKSINDPFYKLGGVRFPNPGNVTTMLSYRNQQMVWEAQQPPPQQFQKIFQDLFHPTYGWLEVHFKQRYKLTFKSGPKALEMLWQSWLDEYCNKSFYTAVHDRMTQAPYYWSADDMAVFGTLGIGTGGFNPLYPVCFMEMIRVLVWGLEEDMTAIPLGMETLIDNFLEREDGPNGESIKGCNKLYLNHPVREIKKDPITGKLTIRFAPSTKHGHVRGDLKGYDAIIVATTTIAMQKMGLTESPLINPDARVALRNLHMMSSSKLFLRTRDKFWLKHPTTCPANIQTDGLPRGVYAVAYPEKATGTINFDTPGVILLSYTWGDDSTKYASSTDKKERYRLVYNALKRDGQNFEMDEEVRRGANIANFVKYLPHPDLVDVNDLFMVCWESEPFQHGGFKVNYPGQEPWLRAAYYQFMEDTEGVYLAGDGVSWAGGWVEGALETGLNCVAAVARQLGGKFYDDSPTPFTQNPHRYNYFGTHCSKLNMDELQQRKDEDIDFNHFNEVTAKLSIK